MSVAAATSLSGQGPKLVDGDGSTIRTFQAAAANCPDQGEVVNLADYPSVGDLAGDGSPDVVKGGLTLNGVANLLAVNQNLPFCHVEQAWNAATGAALPGYPRATDDFQLLSQASIARVAGGGPQRQALVGTGLYQLHAYGPTGRRRRAGPSSRAAGLRRRPRSATRTATEPRRRRGDARGLVVPVGDRPSPRAAAPTTNGGPSTTTSTAPPTTGSTGARPALPAA